MKPVPLAVLLASLSLSGLAGCENPLFPRRPHFSGAYQIAFVDSVFTGMVGDSSAVQVSTSPYSPEEYGLRKVIKSLDEDLIRIDAQGRAICRDLGKTRLAAALVDAGGDVLAADTIAATVPVAKVLTLDSDPGDCAEVHIQKGARSGILYLINNGLHKSADQGRSWRALDLGPERAGTTRPDALAENPFDDRELYAVDVNNYILRSTDAGATWNTALEGYVPGIQGLVYHPRIPNTLFMLTAERDTLRLYKSGDDGSTFAKLAELPRYYSPLVNLLFDPQDDRFIYLSQTPFLSQDGGATWTATPFKLSGQSVLHTRLDGRGRLYSFSGMLIRSDDHGETWETLFLPDEPYFSIRGMDMGPGNAGLLAFFHSGTKRVYLSDNDGYAWSAHSLAPFSRNSCGYGDIALIRDSPPEFLVSDGLFVWRYRHFGN